MKELGYERRFRRWAESAEVGWSRVSYSRASGGSTVAYHLTPASPPRGVVVAAHGAGNDALFGFVALFKSLLSSGFEVFSFDLDGHGRGSTTRFHERQVPSSIRAAVQRCGASGRGLPLHFLGVSVGGSLLLEALPGLGAASASLICAPLHIEFSLHNVLAELGPDLLRTGWQERKHYGVTGLVPAFGPVKRSIYPIRLSTAGGGAFGYVGALNRALERLPLEEIAPRISTPVLLLYGGRDRLAPPSQGERLASLIPGSELKIFPRATHLSLPLAPRTTGLVLDWVEQHAGATMEAKHGPTRSAKEIE